MMRDYDPVRLKIKVAIPFVVWRISKKDMWSIEEKFCERR